MAKAEVLNANNINQPREIIGSRAFNLEYSPRVSNAELRDEIVSYLGEYRFKLQKFNYELIFSGSSNQDLSLRDSHRGEPMRDKAQRAIFERKQRGDPIKRELAELEGISSLEKQLSFPENGDAIVWASPPGSEEEGYGDYGFVYIGKVKKKDNLHAKLSMSAVRVENPTLKQFNNFFSEVSGDNIYYLSEETLLANPKVIPRIEDEKIEHILKRNFSFEIDEDKQRMFEVIIKRMDLTINDFIFLVRSGKRDEKINAFHSLENYFLELKREEEARGESENAWEKRVGAGFFRLRDLLKDYSYTPPFASGSCGSTKNDPSNLKSNNIFSNNFQVLKSIINFDESYNFDDKGTCVKCGRENVERGPCKICKPCDEEIRRSNLWVMGLFLARGSLEI